VKQLDQLARPQGTEGRVQKPSLRAEAGDDSRASVAWVRLQRVPPDMRILAPGLRFFSSSSVRRPRSAARLAAIKPAAPAPTTMTSQDSMR